MSFVTAMLRARLRQAEEDQDILRADLNLACSENRLVQRGLVEILGHFESNADSTPDINLHPAVYHVEIDLGESSAPSSEAAMAICRRVTDGFQLLITRSLKDKAVVTGIGVDELFARDLTGKSFMRINMYGFKLKR